MTSSRLHTVVFASTDAYLAVSGLPPQDGSTWHGTSPDAPSRLCQVIITAPSPGSIIENLALMVPDCRPLVPGLPRGADDFDAAVESTLVVPPSSPIVLQSTGKAGAVALVFESEPERIEAGDIGQWSTEEREILVDVSALLEAAGDVAATVLPNDTRKAAGQGGAGTITHLDDYRAVDSSAAVVDVPLPPFAWRSDAGEQGRISIDAEDEGCVVVEVDDDFYSGRLTREQTLGLAHAILLTIVSPAEALAFAHTVLERFGDDAGEDPESTG